MKKSLLFCIIFFSVLLDFTVTYAAKNSTYTANADAHSAKLYGALFAKAPDAGAALPLGGQPCQSTGDKFEAKTVVNFAQYIVADLAILDRAAEKLPTVHQTFLNNEDLAAFTSTTVATVMINSDNLSPSVLVDACLCGLCKYMGMKIVDSALFTVNYLSRTQN